MQVELKQIQQQVGIQIFVTHDQEEALTLSDEIAVMKEGKIMQIDTPSNIYENPINTFVAGFLGEANFFKGEIVDNEDFAHILKLENGVIMKFQSTKEITPGNHCTLTVRPEKINLTKVPTSPFCIKGTVKFVTYAGDISNYRIESNAQEIRVQQQNLQDALRFQIGDEVYMDWPSESNLVLDYEGDCK